MIKKMDADPNINIEIIGIIGVIIMEQIEGQIMTNEVIMKEGHVVEVLHHIQGREGMTEVHPRVTETCLHLRIKLKEGRLHRLGDQEHLRQEHLRALLEGQKQWHPLLVKMAHLQHLQALKMLVKHRSMMKLMMGVKNPADHHHQWVQPQLHPKWKHMIERQV
jgi:hypothetical protein